MTASVGEPGTAFAAAAESVRGGEQTVDVGSSSKPAPYCADPAAITKERQ